MNIKKIRFQILFSLAFMYFMGPLIWGMWMIFKLNIINGQEFLHCITSPITIIILFSFFSCNWILINKNLTVIMTNIDRNMSDTRLSAIKKSMLFIPKLHIFSIVLFGAGGTFICMLLSLFPSLGFFIETKTATLFTIITGSMAGAGLTLVFFQVFSNMICFILEKLVSGVKEMKKPVISFHFKIIVCNVLAVVIGIVLLYVSGALSIIIKQGALNLSIGSIITRDIVSTTIPVVIGMTSMLIWLVKTIQFHDKTRR